MPDLTSPITFFIRSIKFNKMLLYLNMGSAEFSSTFHAIVDSGLVSANWMTTDRSYQHRQSILLSHFWQTDDF